jgi:hypothetical protein
MLLLLPLPGLASAATLHVTTAGSDSNPCTTDAPCRSIGQATGCMSGGDTVLVHGGTYTEGNITMPNGSEGSPSTLKANPGETVTIRDTSSADCLVCFRNGASWQVVDGFRLDANGSGGFVIRNEDNSRSDYHNLTLRNNEMTGSRHSCLLLSGDHYPIEQNHIHHCGTDQKLDHGIYFSGTQSLIQGNTLDHNACFNIQNYNGFGLDISHNTYDGNTFTASGCGFVFTMGGSHTVINNVMYDDSAQGRTAAFLCCGAGSTVANNTVAKNNGTGMLANNSGDDAGAEVHDNLVCGNSGGQMQLQSAHQSNNQVMDTCPSDLSLVPKGGSTPPAPSPLPAPRKLRVVTVP